MEEYTEPSSNDVQDTQIITGWFNRIHGRDAGHGGLETSVRKLFEIPEVRRRAVRNTLPNNIVKHFKRLIKSCEVCQKLSTRRCNVQARHFTCSTYRMMKRIAIDYIESLTEDENGNDMIIVFIDCFSRFIMLYPVKSTKAKVFFIAFYNGWEPSDSHESGLFLYNCRFETEEFNCRASK